MERAVDDLVAYPARSGSASFTPDTDSPEPATAVADRDDESFEPMPDVADSVVATMASQVAAACRKRQRTRKCQANWDRTARLDDVVADDDAMFEERLQRASDPRWNEFFAFDVTRAGVGDDTDGFLRWYELA